MLMPHFLSVNRVCVHHYKIPACLLSTQSILAMPVRIRVPCASTNMFCMHLCVRMYPVSRVLILCMKFVCCHFNLFMFW